MFEKWLTAREFISLPVIDVFHLESEKKDTASMHPSELRNIHMLVRGTIAIEKKKYGKFTAAVTADDYYKLKLNGKFIAQGPAPSYFFHYNYNLIDVTEYLTDGENTVELDVYYQGLINRVWNSGDLRMGFALEVYGDDKLVCRADESWKYAISHAYLNSPAVGYSTQFLEYYDTRLTPRDEDYQNCVSKAAGYTFADSPLPCISVYPVKPAELLPLEGGGFICDFGQEITASLNITAHGKCGEKVHIYCGEELVSGNINISENDEVRHKMRAGCDYSEYIILSGGCDKAEQYDYKAFRYVSVIPENGAEISDITAMVRHWSFDDSACTIESNDKVLESVFEICKNGVKYGAQEVFVDCPSREKGQYAGDMTVTALSHILLTGDTTLARKALCDQLRSSFICPGIMAVTPGSFMQEIADYSLQLPILVLRDYTYTGDANFMRSCVPYLDNMLEYFKKYASPEHGGLLDGVSGKWNLVDWPDNLRDGYDFPMTNPIGKGLHNVINAFYVGAVTVTEKIKDILQIKYTPEAKQLAQAFNQLFFDYDRGIYRDSPTSSHSALHSNILAPYFGFVPDGYEKSVGDFIMEKGLCCGVYMSFFLLKSLCALGRYNDAYSLITSTAENSWYNMVREGGTCCFEAWGKDKKWNTSLCHPWASAPVSVIIEDILGVHPDGTRTPHIPDGIKITAHLPEFKLQSMAADC